VIATTAMSAMSAPSNVESSQSTATWKTPVGAAGHNILTSQRQARHCPYPGSAGVPLRFVLNPHECGEMFWLF
jgi:hypothetical protein